MRVACGNDKLKLDQVRSVKIIVYVLAIRLKEQVSSVGQVEIVCRFCRDRVSISPGDILVFVRVRLRFENFSPR